MYRKHYVNEIKDLVGSEVEVAGWVHEFRSMGKVRFFILRDKTGTVQVLAKKGLVSDELLENFQYNREDVVSVKGLLKENKVAPNGVEIIPSEIKLLSHIEKKLPVDPSDVIPSELDTRLDFRCVDLRREKISAIFEVKSKIAQAFRGKAADLGFSEIHPTSIVGAATEGGADVFEVKYFERKAYLAQSPQLYKQLAVVGGMDKVYMVTPVFRAEKHATTTHLNEIIQMDVEMGFADHLDAMNVLEKIFLHILETSSKLPELKKLGVELEVPKKVGQYTYDKIIELLKENNFEINWGDDLSKDAEKKLDDLLDESAYFIYEWPTNVRAFYSMPKDERDEVCNAFDLMYKGLEISSGAQRIHIPKTLEDQLRKRDLDPKNFEFYIDAFRYGSPPHAGWSIGLERITQKITNQSNIRECMLFPRDRNRLHP